MPLSSEAQALFDHARNSIPRWLTGSANAALEWLFAFTEIFDSVRALGQEWLDITLLDNAVGAELDQHAYDRGTSRRAGEGDPALRERLRNISDSVTEPALVAGTNRILEGISIHQRLYVERWTVTGWNTHFVGLSSSPEAMTLTMVGDGTAAQPVIEISGGAITIHFQIGVTTYEDVQDEVALNGVIFAVQTPASSGATALVAGDEFGPVPFFNCGIVGLRRDRGHMHLTGTCTAFASRGYRMTGTARPMTYIVILPYGTDSATASAVEEYLRKNGPGGYNYLVERRLNP